MWLVKESHLSRTAPDALYPGYIKYDELILNRGTKRYHNMMYLNIFLTIQYSCNHLLNVEDISGLAIISDPLRLRKPDYLGMISFFFMNEWAQIRNKSVRIIYLVILNLSRMSKQTFLRSWVRLSQVLWLISKIGIIFGLRDSLLWSQRTPISWVSYINQKPWVHLK